MDYTIKVSDLIYKICDNLLEICIIKNKFTNTG